MFTSTITPPTAEHRLRVSFDANRKHAVLFPTTWHADDFTSGEFDDVTGGVGDRDGVGRPTKMDRATMNPKMKAKTAINRTTEGVIDLRI